MAIKVRLTNISPRTWPEPMISRNGIGTVQIVSDNFSPAQLNVAVSVPFDDAHNKAEAVSKILDKLKVVADQLVEGVDKERWLN